MAVNPTFDTLKKLRRIRTSLYQASEAAPYAAQRPRHSARAAARLSLKFDRE